NTGHNGYGYPPGLRAVDKIEIGIRIEEILRDGTICAGVYFVDEVIEVLSRAAGLGMHFRVGGNLYMEPVIAVLAYEGNEFVSVMQIARVAPHARRQVTAQGNHPAYAKAAIRIQGFSQKIAAGPYAR